MLRPQYWLRQPKLQRALVDYPVYDPPHKSEERVLPEDKARENFQYFLSVRHERLDFFFGWLERQFGVQASLEGRGLEAFLDWAKDYIALLLPDKNVGDVFMAYAQPWSGRYAGSNVLFDIGIATGEAIILQRPDLVWCMEWPLVQLQGDQKASREARVRSIQRYEQERKRNKNSGYRRPSLASIKSPAYYAPVFATVFSFHLMQSLWASFDLAWKEFKTPKASRSQHPDKLRRFVFDAINEQPMLVGNGYKEGALK